MSAAQRDPLIARARQMHEQQNMSQRAIAEKLGVSQPTISNWLRRRTPQERVAEKIRAELVCCDIYQRMEDAYDPEDDSGYRALRHSRDYHDMCFYGEWAARTAEQTP